MALRISDLGTAPTVEETDLVEIAEVDGESPSGYSSYKTTILGIANKIATSTVFSGLVTATKNLVGSINEVNGLLDLKESKADMEDDVTEILEDLSDDFTVTGNPVTFETINGGVAKSCEVIMLPIQSGTGDPSPTNIRPISGWDSVKVTRTGVNQWDEVTEVGGISEADGSLNTNANFLRSKNPIRMSHDMTYYVYSKKGNQAVLYYYDENMNYLGFKVSTNLVVTPPENTYYARLRTPNYSTQLYENGDISINYPSTTTEYEPYNGQTHTATFPSTIMGGSYDFVSGNGSETISDKVDLGSLAWRKATGYFYSSISSLTPPKRPSSDIVPFVGNCESYKVSYLNDTSDGIITMNRTGNAQIYIRDTARLEYTEEEFKTFLSGKYFCYKLATPQEITLTAEQIELLKGTNVLSTDADELKLVASKLANVPDLLTYIQSLEARIKALEEA